MLDLDGRFQRLVNSKSKAENNLGQGLSTGILMYCIGTLSILGPVMSALQGDHTFLFTNATLDLVTSMVLASAYGIGMALAAPVLLAGSHLSGCQIFVRLFLLGNLVGRTFYCGRNHDFLFRTVHSEDQGLQDAEYSSVTVYSHDILHSKRILWLTVLNSVEKGYHYSTGKGERW